MEWGWRASSEGDREESEDDEESDLCGEDG